MGHLDGLGQLLSLYETSPHRFIANLSIVGIMTAHSGFSRGPASNGGELFYLYNFLKPAFTRSKSSSSIVPNFDDKRR